MCLGRMQDLTENVLKPTARDVADKLPGAAERLNEKVKANAEEVVGQLQSQVRGNCAVDTSSTLPAVQLCSLRQRLLTQQLGYLLNSEWAATPASSHIAQS